MVAKSWTVELVDGDTVTQEAEIVTYDQAANLIFCNNKKAALVGQEDGLELLMCINREQFIRYYPTPTLQ